MWNKKEMSQLDATLTRVPLTFTFDFENSRSNCISGMGDSIVMERKRQESLGCPGVKHNHYVTQRQRILLTMGWLKMSALPSTWLVTSDFSISNSGLISESSILANLTMFCQHHIIAWIYYVLITNQATLLNALCCLICKIQVWCDLMEDKNWLCNSNSTLLQFASSSEHCYRSHWQ